MMNNEEIIDRPNHLMEHDYFVPVAYEDNHNKVHKENAVEEVMEFEEEREAKKIAVVGVSETYRLIPDAHNKSTIYVDNLGFKYFKHEVRGVYVYLVCEQQNEYCHCTAIVSSDSLDNRIHLQNYHNHQPKEIDVNLQFLRESNCARGIDAAATTSLKRCLCDNEIINHPNATQVKKMRQQPPLDIGQLANALNE